MTREDQEAIDQIRELISDRSRLELFAEHAVAELLASLTTRGEPGSEVTFCQLSGEQALQLVRLGKTALGIGDLPAPRAVPQSKPAQGFAADMVRFSSRFAVGGGI